MLNTNNFSQSLPVFARLIPKSVFIFQLFPAPPTLPTSTRTHSSSCSTIYHLKSGEKEKRRRKNDFIICDEMKKENKIKSPSSESEETQADAEAEATTAKIVTFIYGFISPFISVYKAAAVNVVVVFMRL